METEEITYSKGLINPRWDQEDVEYLITNASHFNKTELASHMGCTASAIADKLKILGLSDAFIGKLPHLEGLQYVPEGMTQKRSLCGAGGMIYRIPSSTPGIVSRTIHVCGAHAEINRDYDKEFDAR